MDGRLYCHSIHVDYVSADDTRADIGQHAILPRIHKLIVDDADICLGKSAVGNVDTPKEILEIAALHKDILADAARKRFDPDAHMICCCPGRRTRPPKPDNGAAAIAIRRVYQYGATGRIDTRPADDPESGAGLRVNCRDAAGHLEIDDSRVDLVVDLDTKADARVGAVDDRVVRATNQKMRRMANDAAVRMAPLDSIPAPIGEIEALPVIPGDTAIDHRAEIDTVHGHYRIRRIGRVGLDVLKRTVADDKALSDRRAVVKDRTGWEVLEMNPLD